MAHKTLTEKNLENFISNNYDKNDKRKDDSKKFEWFVNSMHIWSCSSLFYNSKSKIGKEVSLGSAQGGDAFFIIVNNEQIFTLNDNIDDVIKYTEDKGRDISFHFIQSKKSDNARWGDYLKFIDIVLMILKGENVGAEKKELLKVKNFYDALTNGENAKLGKIKHKLELHFYTDKNENDIEQLRKDWDADIKRQLNIIKEYISDSNVTLQGSQFINNLYERFTSNKYELIISKDEVIEIDELKYIIGFVTAKELLDCIAPISGVSERIILPDVFKNNIRLYIGNTSVNENIEKTLLAEPEKFHFYNNGLTITTKEISDKNAKNYLITPVNIVNGCQTANSIYNVFKSNHDNEKNVKIPVKIIVAQDSEYEKITIRTNAQNGLAEKELISITKIQKEMEDLFGKINLCGKTFFYKRQNSIEIDKPDIDFIVKIDDILRASFSTLLLIPNKVTGYFDVTTSKYLDKIFEERFLNLYAVLTALLKLVESNLDNESDLSRLRYHICYLIYKYLNKGLDVKKIEEYFRVKSVDDEQPENEIEGLDELITNITSNIFKYLKNEDIFLKIFEYIITKIKSDYCDLLDLSSREKEKLLYKPVEKLYRTRTPQPLFENFNGVFVEDIGEIVDENK